MGLPVRYALLGVIVNYFEHCFTQPLQVQVMDGSEVRYIFATVQQAYRWVTEGTDQLDVAELPTAPAEQFAYVLHYFVCMGFTVNLG